MTEFDVPVKSQIRLVCATCSRCFANDITICPHDGTELTAEKADALVGTILGGHYEILEVLGKGGMSTVYKARQIMVDKLVAIEVMHTYMTQNPQSVRRFQQEAKATFATSRFPEAQVFFERGVELARESDKRVLIESALKDQAAFFRKSGHPDKAEPIEKELASFSN